MILRVCTSTSETSNSVWHLKFAVISAFKKVNKEDDSTNGCKGIDHAGVINKCGFFYQIKYDTVRDSVNSWIECKSKSYSTLFIAASTIILLDEFQFLLHHVNVHVNIHHLPDEKHLNTLYAVCAHAHGGIIMHWSAF